MTTFLSNQLKTTAWHLNLGSLNNVSTIQVIKKDIRNNKNVGDFSIISLSGFKSKGCLWQPRNCIYVFITGH